VKQVIQTGRVAVLTACVAVATAASVAAHHSFAMYDQTTTKTLTGKLTRYIPGANHAQIIFQLLDESGHVVMKDGKAVTWGFETGSATAMARQGVSPDTFPDGTILSVRLYPLRDGRNFGALAGMLVHCGKDFPKGGCTATTGKRVIGEEFDAR
jgi:hypothetical protein